MTDSQNTQPGEEDANQGQVSEVSSLKDAPAPVASEDATAGYPPSESGRADEGTAGPNAAPRRNPPERENKSSK